MIQFKPTYNDEWNKAYIYRRGDIDANKILLYRVSETLSVKY